jgi:hypothetical protein
LKDSIEFVKQQYPDASFERQIAFMNSVTYLVAGKVRDAEKLSIREHLVRWWAQSPNSVKFDRWSINHDNPLPKPGEWTVENACLVCETFCFRDLPKSTALRIAAIEQTYYDDTEDVETIKEWEKEELRSLKVQYSAEQLNQQQANRAKFLKDKLQQK